jgi:PPOX class probable F420-dependent enzyme
MTVIPASHEDLLTRPLFAHLGTVRPDGTPQVNPMWFSWDGTYLRFTNTTTRRKYRNVSLRPDVAISVNDPEAPYRYLEVRGSVVRVEEDPQAEFFGELARRYGFLMDGPPGDAPDRVVLVVEPRAVSFQ